MGGEQGTCDPEKAKIGTGSTLLLNLQGVVWKDSILQDVKSLQIGYDI